jgi:hypothetical protein
VREMHLVIILPKSTGSCISLSPDGNRTPRVTVSTTLTSRGEDESDMICIFNNKGKCRFSSYKTKT